MARPPRFDCPVHLIVTAPAMMVANGPVYRATIALAVAYWTGECTLPWHDETTIASLCRMPIAHVRPIKSAIIHALSQITPELDKIRRQRVKTYESRYGCITHATAVRDRGRAMRQAGTPSQPTNGLELAAPAVRHETSRQQGPARHERKAYAASPQSKPATSSTAMFVDRPAVAIPNGDDEDGLT